LAGITTDHVLQLTSCILQNALCWFGVSAVPIYELLERRGSFGPDEVAGLGNVFTDVLRALGLVHRKDPVTEMVAKKMVELAMAGIREPDRLKALTLQAFTQQPLQQQQRKLRQRQSHQQAKHAL
jgi:hypothetical protein